MIVEHKHVAVDLECCQDTNTDAIDILYFTQYFIVVQKYIESSVKAILKDESLLVKLSDVFVLLAIYSSNRRNLVCEPVW